MTLNVKDFRSKMLTELGVEILSPGALVDRLLDDIPESVVLAVHQISSRLEEPVAIGSRGRRRPAGPSDDG